MGRCEPEQEIWEKLKSPVWCRSGLCGTSMCVDTSAMPAYERAAKNIVWEIGKTNYIFRAMPGESCISFVYSDELTRIPFEKFVMEIATPVYPKDECPSKLYWKIGVLASDIYCAYDIAERLGAPLNAVLACAGEAGKEREVAVKSVGGTYFIVLGPIKRINSPLFR